MEEEDRGLSPGLADIERSKIREELARNIKKEQPVRPEESQACV